MSRSPLTFPDCPFVARSVRIGGTSKRELLERLRSGGIELNEAGRELFAHDGFTVLEKSVIVTTVEITVANLGFVDGATSADLFEKAVQLNLMECPLELGPHLRLQYLDQPEGSLGHMPSQHRAPPGSLTIASVHSVDNDDMPKGFYLRRINGVLWLRGYREGPDHVWTPEDHFVFAFAPNAVEPFAD